MNLSDMKVVSAAKAGAEMPLLSPFNGEPTGAFLIVEGFDSPAMIKAARDYDREAASNPASKDTDEALRLRRAHLGASALKGWRNFEWDGKALEFTPEKAMEICMDPEYQWITEQVVRFGGSRRNFTPKPKGAASSGQAT
ncbi:MAG: hypothetical protein ACPG61_07270 [Paracoccaceae bacterium]